jgi:hypothetical protein
MPHDSRQVDLLVRILIAKHGPRAPDAAADRVRQWMQAGDEETAALWVAVVKRASARLALQREPSFEDVLDGSVTRQMMDADRVEREEVEAAMGETRDRLARKE